MTKPLPKPSRRTRALIAGLGKVVLSSQKLPSYVRPLTGRERQVADRALRWALRVVQSRWDHRELIREAIRELGRGGGR